MSWGGGYVTDIPYMPGYFRTQAPMHLALACLLGSVAPPFAAGSDDELHYLELGCGQGFGALALAAGNPGWRITGIDFNPGHVAAARALAAEAGMDNAEFIEADLATLADSAAARAIPQADVVSMHGVWTWVPPEVRAGIVRLLQGIVRPGGLVHVSYNALPAWQGALGLQRMVREAGKRLASRSDRQALAGLEAARALAEAGGERLRDTAIAQNLLQRARGFPPEYLAHEYMNASWSPCFHADVAEALSGAKLEWVASANLLENFAALALSDAEREVMDRFDDPLMRELAKDMCLGRGLRSDVFIRGPARMDPAARDRALAELRLALLRPAERVEYEAELPAGTASLDPAF
jgi:SAM-dependent methyltransferase